MSTADDTRHDDDGRTVRLTIPARPEYIALCRLALMGISRLRTLSEELVEDLKLALTEACTNSVRHAYGDSPNGGHVEIVYELHPDRLAIEVTDDGRAGPPSTVDGNGLRGIEERVAALGGEFTAGPLAGGGFRVWARLPVAAARTEQDDA